MEETICSGEMAKSQRAALRSFYLYLFWFSAVSYFVICMRKWVESSTRDTTRNGLIEIACIECSDSRTPTVDCCAFFWCAIKIENRPKIDGLKVDAETVRQCQRTQIRNYRIILWGKQSARAHNKRTNPNGTTNEHGHFQLFQNKQAGMGATNPSCGPLIARHSFHLINFFLLFSLFFLKAEDSIW